MENEGEPEQTKNSNDRIIKPLSVPADETKPSPSNTLAPESNKPTFFHRLFGRTGKIEPSVEQANQPPALTRTVSDVVEKTASAKLPPERIIELQAQQSKPKPTNQGTNPPVGDNEYRPTSEDLKRDWTGSDK